MFRALLVLSLFSLAVSESEIKQLIKLWRMAGELPKKDHGNFSIEDLPQNFDARAKWPECPSLKEVRDQSSCGSDWAIPAVAAMTDRLCIKSGGKNQDRLSAANLLSCCEECSGGDGCIAGFGPAAWKYYENEGLVTGGEQGSDEGCQPYPFPKCEHGGVKGKYQACFSRYTPYAAPACKRHCRHGYNTTYNRDLKFGKNTYKVKGEANIMKELVENGPVQALITVNADLYQYKTGVYRHTSGARLYGSSVKLLGYGVEKGEKYWLAANSWNEDWGDKGFFKILRGSNECGIEAHVFAGEPDL